MTLVSNHPDYPQELAKLHSILQYLQTESITAQIIFEDARQNYFGEFSSAGGNYSNELMLAVILYNRAEQRLRNLTLASKKPYFTRVNFTPTNEAPETHYIGKYGILDDSTMQPVIVDWRSPIANLYYSGQVGQMSYTAPDGTIEGDLTLKRQFTIEDAVLKAIFDTEVVSPDAYLQQVLGKHATDRMQDIVNSIQREQNDIIRADKAKPVVVQGVAGSGKTSIALHRIAYLLYSFQDNLAPENMLILAPNPLFLDYISGVLPELGVENMKQTTFEALCAELLDKDMPKLAPDNHLEFLIDERHTQEEKDLLKLSCRIKGDLRYKEAADEYLADLERSIVPKGDLKFGPYTVFTYAQLQNIFCVELKPHDFRTRIVQMRKHIVPAVRAASEKIVALLEDECEKRIFAVTHNNKLSQAQKQRHMKTIYAARDERKDSIQKGVVTAVNEYLKTWPKLGLLDCYRAFVQGPYGQCRFANDWQAAKEHTMPLLDRKCIEREDLPCLIHIMRKIGQLNGGLRVLHIVIDEAQDFSPMHFFMLKELANHPSFTIVGDLAQGIHSYRAIENWQQTMDVVFENPVYLSLITSYRNTVEIMSFASRVLQKFPQLGVQKAKPVLRYGEDPSVHVLPQDSQRYEAIVAEVLRHQADGYQTIGVIGKTQKACVELQKNLRTHGLELAILNAEDTSYHGGAKIIPAPMTKGLEFDCVIIEDVSAEQYGQNPIDGAILYVSCTRALHRLTCFASGPVTPLLQNVEAI